MTLDARFVQRRAPGAWKADAACADADPAIFFPRHGGFQARQANAQAKAICATCPVKASCLEHALDQNETEGVWGGLSADERRRLRPSRTVICANCAEPFVAGDTRPRRLCSDECRTAAHRDAKRRYQERVTA